MQDVLEAAAAKLTHGAPVPSTVAGRTDAGVHAEAQVAHDSTCPATGGPTKCATR